ncbi:hypothetical protein B4U84_24455 [Westiellopsis prolifica IICB1]|nr:hypothetical protein B4U84_24455 [Westiellopsis prolifica IICB1]
MKSGLNVHQLSKFCRNWETSNLEKKVGAVLLHYPIENTGRKLPTLTRQRSVDSLEFREHPKCSKRLRLQSQSYSESLLKADCLIL